MLTFRQRFDDLENRRDRLIARLSTLGEQARQHPAHRRALSLLNVSFRRASLSQRGSVLQAAEWLIEVLERLTVML